MRTMLLLAVLATTALNAQGVHDDGLWQGYDGEWNYSSRQLVSLAEAIPAEKFDWCPGPGVRSTGEVYMHIIQANYGLLSATGISMPTDLKTQPPKAELIALLKRSIEAVRTAHAKLAPPDLQRKVKIAGRDATVEGIYLRILVHAHEHMGQLVAYARMNGIAPPWSRPAGQ